MKHLTIILFILTSCTKENTCKEITYDTFTNYQGYWSYCHNGIEDINTELIYQYTKTETICEPNTIRDTIYCKKANCPRIGFIYYQTQIKVK